MVRVFLIDPIKSLHADGGAALTVRAVASVKVYALQHLSILSQPLPPFRSDTPIQALGFCGFLTLSIRHIPLPCVGSISLKIAVSQGLCRCVGLIARERVKVSFERILKGGTLVPPRRLCARSDATGHDDE